MICSPVEFISAEARLASYPRQDIFLVYFLRVFDGHTRLHVDGLGCGIRLPTWRNQQRLGVRKQFEGLSNLFCLRHTEDGNRAHRSCSTRYHLPIRIDIVPSDSLYSESRRIIFCGPCR
jgi:hypothetical protein